MIIKDKYEVGDLVEYVSISDGCGRHGIVTGVDIKEPNKYYCTDINSKRCFVGRIVCCLNDEITLKKD